MMDSQGRIWTASQVRDHVSPAFCQQGSSLESAMAFPIKRGSRQVNMYDPKTKQWTLVDMCSSSLHLNFANDANHTLWIGNPGSDVIGWLNTKMFDQTHDVQKSQGWTALVLDTNGKRQARRLYGSRPAQRSHKRHAHEGRLLRNRRQTSGGRLHLGHPSSAAPGGIIRVNPGPGPGKNGSC